MTSLLFVRNPLPVLSFLVSISTAYAQPSTTSTSNDTLPFPDVYPSFRGGQANWVRFIQRTLQADVANEFGATPGQYTVTAEFWVEPDSTVTHIVPVTNHGFGMEGELIRVIRLSGRWSPGLLKGKPIRSRLRQSVIFQVLDE